MSRFPSAPTDDVEALVFSLTVHVKRVGLPDATGGLDVEFDYHCEECGGWVITLPNGDGPDDPAQCKACGWVFGKYSAVLALCRDVYRMHAAAPDLARHPPPR